MAPQRQYDRHMEISRLTAEDAPTAATELAGIYSSGTIDATGLRSALGNEDFVLLVARTAARLAGYLHGAFIHRVDGGLMLMVYDLEVVEAQRRTGVGTALMGSARQLARAEGASETWLVTESDNAAATALYESLGGTKFPAVGYEWSEQ